MTRKVKNVKTVIKIIIADAIFKAKRKRVRIIRYIVKIIMA